MPFPLARLLVVLSCLVTVSVATPVRVAAWSSTGHMIIAGIAYRDLSPALQREYTTLLASHPAYASWKKNFKGNLDEGAYLFMRASVWPDELKSDRGNPDLHAEWHYINMPLIPPAYPLRDAPRPGPKGDIMTAIEINRSTLARRSETPIERAIALAWIIHLVGDLHQPLHTTALINDTYELPFGDKGGNAFFMRPSERAKRPISLHSFWDGLLGTSKNFGNAYREALTIEREHARSSFVDFTSTSSVRDWMLESRQLAIDSVYMRGELSGSHDRTDTTHVMPASYRQRSKSVAERRVALAGYRLGAMLARE